MRYSAAEKQEIIKLVAHSSLSVRIDSRQLITLSPNPRFPPSGLRRHLPSEITSQIHSLLVGQVSSNP